MPRIRARMPSRRLANVTLAVALSILAFAAIDQPVRAADDAAVIAAAVAAMEAAGMECQDQDGGTGCDLGSLCPDVTCVPSDGTAVIDGWSGFEESLDGEPPIPRINVSYLHAAASNDPSEARPVFMAVIDATCPGAAATADDWFSTPEPFALFPGTGCTVELSSGTNTDGPTLLQGYDLLIYVDAIEVPPPAAATPIAPAAVTPVPGTLAADALALMEQAGMDCISKVGVTHCEIGMECEFDADGALQCSYPMGATVSEGSISEQPTGGPALGLSYRHLADAPDPSATRPLFDAMIELACPGAADAASGWFSAPTPMSRYPGDGCVAAMLSSSLPNPTGGTEQTYQLNFDLNGPDPSTSPAASVAPAPSATAAAIIASPEPSAPAGDSGGAVIPPGGFVASITTPSNVTMDPTVAIQSAALALLILFLMPFPAQLFNSTVEEHRDEIRGWFAPLARGLRSAGSGIGAFWRSPVGIVAFLVASALLYALLDPTFSLSVDGLITIVGILAGLVVVTALFSVPAVLWHGRRGDRPVIEAIPFTLLIAVVCVGISRLADFQPGYLYGLIIGLGFARTLDPSGEGRSGAAAAALMLVSALVAWVGLGWMVDAGIQGFVAVVIATILAAIMVAGLEGVAFGLLPIRSLPGEPIYAWNRIVWGGLIFVGLFAFMHVLINPQSGYLADSSRTPLFTMLALLIGFGVASVAFWGYFRFRPERVAT